ncbi:S26 family signal peptidase [Nonomuraea sp. NPDC048826]|uniref:S26 family signal peptidase n=1 Tax=Nonomuraea sp. NPDC048826 TaxID=3364347 RepID=UPI00370FD98B
MITAVVVTAVAVLAGALLWVRRRYVLITVRGLSMWPTYHDGDRVLIRRVPVTAVRAGQVVVVAASPRDVAVPGRGTRWLLKRAVAVPGDPVPRDRFPALRSVPDPAVPPGHLVVLGDNPSQSYDSRQAGYMPPGRLLGVVARRVGGVPSPPGPA